METSLWGSWASHQEQFQPGSAPCQLDGLGQVTQSLRASVASPVKWNSQW